MSSFSYDPTQNWKVVSSLLTGADNVTIIAPFITKVGLNEIIEKLSSDSSLTIFTRWNLEEVAAGVSDPGIIDLINKNSSIFLNSNLHAKAYIRHGSGALVGSANVTGRGLGLSSAGSAELLVDVEEKNERLVSLLNYLDACSGKADRYLADRIKNDAAIFKNKHKDFFDKKRSRSNGSEVWLPLYSYPKALWYIYSGKRGERLYSLAEHDLIALDLPKGLDVEEFNALVCHKLGQGLVAKIATEAIGLSAYKAVLKFKNLSEAAGCKVEDPEHRWNTLVAWLTHFMPERYELSPGGKKIARKSSP